MGNRPRLQMVSPSVVVPSPAAPVFIVPPSSLFFLPAVLEDPSFGRDVLLAMATGMDGAGAPEDLNEEEDRRFRDELKRKLKWLTIMCFFANLSLLIVGHAAFNRSVGPFVSVNILTLILFAGGALLFVLRKNRTQSLFLVFSQ